MANDDEGTAASIHANSFSTIGVVAGLLTAVILLPPCCLCIMIVKATLEVSLRALGRRKRRSRLDKVQWADHCRHHRRRPLRATCTKAHAGA